VGKPVWGVKKGKVKKNPGSKGSSSVPPLLYYSGLGFQLLGVVLLGLWLGGKLDRYFNLELPLFTAFLCLFLIIGFIVKLIRELAS
jgi:hypothetical protein